VAIGQPNGDGSLGFEADLFKAFDKLREIPNRRNEARAVQA